MPDGSGDSDVKQGKRIFSRSVKEECWKRAQSVPGRDPERWKYDAAGRIVGRALTSCMGPLCHEYDHIVPWSRGGGTVVENCQILQTRSNRDKRDRIMNTFEIKSTIGLQIYPQQQQEDNITIDLSHEELDLIEMAVYGDVRRIIEGPMTGYFTSIIECECFNNASPSNTGRICSRPQYDMQTPIEKN